MPMQSDIGFTKEQINLLREIHALARDMEKIKNSEKVHSVIAMIEELSNEYLDVVYLVEKLNLLFAEEGIEIKIEG